MKKFLRRMRKLSRVEKYWAALKVSEMSDQDLKMQQDCFSPATFSFMGARTEQVESWIYL